MFVPAGWRWTKLETDQPQLTAYIVIRDPIARWFSGLDQYAHTHDDYPYLRILNEVREGRSPIFAELTKPQVRFFPPTVANRTLVRLEDSAEYVARRWGLVLPVKNRLPRGPRLFAPDLVPMLEDFYADDLAIYREGCYG